MVDFIDKALKNSTQQSNLRSELRASNLPFCEREYVLHRLAKLGVIDELDYEGETTMAMGTAMHTTTQKHLGLAGVLYGNWTCPKCDVMVKNQTGPVYCSKCNELCTYTEFEIAHSCGLSGHVDGVTLQPVRAVLEYKSSNQFSMSKMTDPVWYHFLQANFYCCALNEQLGLQLEQIIIMYVDRAFPKNRKFFVRKPNIAAYGNLVKQVISAKEKLRLKILPERTLCDSFEEGVNMKCIYRYVCFNDDASLQKLINQ